MSKIIYKTSLLTLVVLISFSCKKWTLSKEEKEKCLEKGTKQNGYLVYEVNENFAATKNGPGSEPEYDINCDGKADFKFVSTIQMYTPIDGWRSSTVQCLHGDAFIMGYTSVDTIYNYQDTLIQNTNPPIFCNVYTGQACSNNYDVTTVSSVSTKNHAAYLSSADQAYSGTWFSESFTFQTINTSYWVDELVTTDTTYKFFNTQKLYCRDMSNSGSTFIKFKIVVKKKEIEGAFEMASPDEIKSVWVKD